MSEKQSKSMTPFIMICAGFILATMLILSIHGITNPSIPVLPGSGAYEPGHALSIDMQEMKVFPEALSYPRTPMVQVGYGPEYYPQIARIRRMLVLGAYKSAEDELRTLYLFFPDDPEVTGLLVRTLEAQKKVDEARYYQEQLLFLQEYPGRSVGDRT